MFTSEAVTAGHPDKGCDQISDAVLDAFLAQDPQARVACEAAMAYRDGEPVGADTVVVSIQHSPAVSQAQLREDVVEHIVRPAIAAVRPNIRGAETTYHVNPTGRFVIGGPAADAGLTGRKIAVDTYGAMARHGGGAVSGKDPTKVDHGGGLR